MYFDTHAHYDSSAFASDRDEILTALPQAGGRKCQAQSLSHNLHG